MKLFEKNRKQFDYQSDALLVAALIAGQQAAFDYVFDRYHELLQCNIKSAFHIEKEKAERIFKKRCGELQTFLLDNDSAKLKLFNPDESDFNVWLATVSLSFFKKTFRDENSAVVEGYKGGDKAIFYERFKYDFEKKIRETGEKDNDVISQEAKLLSDDLFIHLSKDNWRGLSSYDPSRQTFDVWFGWVLRNYAIDQFRKRIKKTNEDVYSSIHSKKSEDDVIEQSGLFRIDEQETISKWEQQIFTVDDEDKEELIELLRKALKTLEPPRYRDILMDLYFEGKTYDEIIENYQVTKANAYNIVSRALYRLKTIIEEEYGLRTKR